MSPRAKFFALWYGAAIWWDFMCPPGQTVSEFLAGRIRNKYTRVPVSLVILATVVHLFALACERE